MEILGQTPVQSILFFTLYGVTGVVPLIAALYLLLQRANAIAPGVTPPVRLRRWTAAFFAFTALAHLWWLLFLIYSNNLDSLGYQLIVLIDSILLLTTIAGTMLSMLQDRRRPVWPVLAALLPFVGLFGVYMTNPSHLLQQIIVFYLLLLSLLFTVYMVLAIRRYDRWLNDNYADLEHKRVWLSQVVAFLCMLVFVLYEVSEDMVLIYCLHLVDLVLIFLLLWRVETLPSLSLTPDPSPTGEGSEYSHGQKQADELSTPLPPREGLGESLLDHIEKLLKEYCVAQQIYLQQDLTLEELAQAIGTNRSYLSQYFSRQGYTYNTYINSLRVNHFISRYEEVAKTQQPFTVQQLAEESGFRSYSTFSRAFTQRMGQSVKAWMQGKGE